MLRMAGFALVTVPAVALAHLLVTGTVPTVTSLVAVALVAALVAVLTTRTRSGSLAVTGQLALTQVLGHGAVWLSMGEPGNSCLPVMGRGAALGVRLALLRQDPSCAPGSYAVGPATMAAAALLLLTAVLVLGQLMVAALGSLALHAVQRAWVSVTALLAAAVLVLRRFIALVVPGPQRRRSTEVPARPAQHLLARSLSRRGLPVPA